MRLFQNSGIYPAYRPRLRSLTKGLRTFDEQMKAFLTDRYGAVHILQPVLEHDPSAFLANGDDEIAQKLWAREQGMTYSATLESILLAQIEHHRTEVLYNQDPMRYGSDFVRKLPGCVRKRIAWRAAPSPGADFAAYDLVVCNFPSILESYRRRGWAAAYFAPAYDPEMEVYAANTNRETDVVFVGGYSRHHQRRARVLEAVARLRGHRKIVFHLDRSRLTRLAESPVGRMLPLGAYRRPADIRAVSASPVFGRELYSVLSHAKVVLNGAVDMAGEDRGNMRCFEALGCGALMVSDHGQYPIGMVEGQTMLSYRDPKHAASIIDSALRCPAMVVELARKGHSEIRKTYGKGEQWRRFQNLADGSTSANPN